MEGTNIDEAAVACPVCTLYLREGISLQRHLDTHPKEQVIEALIKASAGAGAGASASASASTAQGQQTQTQTQTPLSPVSLISTTSVQQPSHNTSHLAHNSQVSPQSPYPIGPVFECPPIGTVMPPQFASFSYQQFVNNGTVMIPQYAMAPQANQMMQMLYNPYSIYQQQQIPTVQMLSPVNTLPNTNRLRTVPTLANDTTPRPSITIPVNNNEPKEILPEILSEVEPEPEQEPNQQPDTHTGPESERMVTELDAVRIPPSLNHSDIIQQDHNGLGTQGVRRDHHQSPPIPPSIPITCNISNISNIIENDDADGGDEEDEDDDDEDDVDDDDDDEDDDDKAETVLPNIHNAQPTNPSIQLPSSICNISCRDVSTVQQQQQDLQEEYIHTTYKECVGENVSNEITLTVSEDKAKECRRINDRLTYNKDVQMADSIISPKRQSPSALSKESCQPVEVEQLEHLLITIMERELGSTTEEEAGKEERGEKRNEGTRQKALKDEADAVVKEGMCLEDGGGNNEIARETISPDVKLPLNTAMRLTVNDLDKNYYSTYRYKHSLSAPSSPISPKKAYHSYSTHSEFGSAENLNIYPVGFDASVLQDEDEEDEDEDEDEEEEEEEEEEDEDADEEIDEENDSEANENDEEKERLDLEENLDEADMEIEEIPSPHTPAAKSGESCDYVRSHTPLSTSSGISVLRVRKDLSKSCSPMSVHSFPHMETTGTNQEESSNNPDKLGTCFKTPINCLQLNEEANNLCQEVSLVEEEVDNKSVSQHINSTYHQPIITDNLNSFPTVSSVQQEVALSHDSYSAMASNKAQNSMSLPDSFEAAIAIETTESKSYHYSKPIVQKQSLELLNLNEDAHAGPMNVFEFDGLQILVPSTYINESSQKAVSATSQQSMASSEGAVGIDEEVKSINMRADETMPPRGELSEQESNGYTEQSAWQLYMGQESSRMSTSYDLMARESWEESEGSDNEIGGPLLDSRSLATHFTSSLFLDRDRKSPTKRTFKCYHCSEVFDCPKERRVHSTTVHKEAGPSSSGRQSNQGDQVEVKDIKLLDGRVNIFEDIFVPGLHVQQIYHHQQPLLHQLQPAQTPELNKLDSEGKADSAVVQLSVEVTCTICSQRFSSDKSLQLHHRRVHVAEASKRIRESAKCQICNEEFPSVLLFNAHLKVHPLECSQCGKYFYRKQNFKLHMKRHLGIKPFPCTVCDKAFLTKQKLDEHTNGHTGNAPVKCNLCNETFRRYSNLTQHKNRHHLNIKKKLKDYICHCGEVFHTKKKLAWHKETHDEKPKACTYCNERFIHMASLTRHMRRAHNRRFVPDAHRESENVECPICKCIYLRSSLAVHMRVHNGERPYECQVCSKAFSTKWNLQLHKWTHAARSTKPFKCNQCSAAFYRHSDYTAHMNSHRNVRPYTCNYCGAQFIRKYNCLRHVKEHEENKAYTCDVCNKTFHRSYYLKEHLRVHSGARPYTCHICGKSSGTKSNHNKHVRIHHAREPVNTEN